MRLQALGLILAMSALPFAFGCSGNDSRSTGDGGGTGGDGDDDGQAGDGSTDAGMGSDTGSDAITDADIDPDAGPTTGSTGGGGMTSGGPGAAEVREAIETAGTVRASRLATGDTHVCHVLGSGDLKCWGDNTDGALGLGDVEDRGDEAGEMGAALPVVDLGESTPLGSLHAGALFSCAASGSGTVKCWGSNSIGSLGLGPTTAVGDVPGEMGDALPLVDLGAQASVAALTTGAVHACAVLTGGTLKCWGANSSGQLGYGHSDALGRSLAEMGDNLPLVDVGADVAGVDAGDTSTCVVATAGAVKCWGSNRSGQLGLGDTDDRGDEPDEMGAALPAVDLGSSVVAVRVSVGPDHACALSTTGAIKCWGRNSGGELGLGDTMDRGAAPGDMGDNLAAVELGTDRYAVDVTVGGAWTCALLDDATVKCWGRAPGYGDREPRGDEPGEMGDSLAAVDLGTGRTVAAVDCSPRACCAVLDNDDVKCWGEQSSGNLGQGDTNDIGDEAGEMGDDLPAIQL